MSACLADDTRELCYRAVEGFDYKYGSTVIVFIGKKEEAADILTKEIGEAACFL